MEENTTMGSVQQTAKRAILNVSVVRTKLTPDGSSRHSNWLRSSKVRCDKSNTQGTDIGNFGRSQGTGGKTWQIKKFMFYMKTQAPATVRKNHIVSYSQWNQLTIKKNDHWTVKFIINVKNVSRRINRGEWCNVLPKKMRQIKSADKADQGIKSNKKLGISQW